MTSKTKKVGVGLAAMVLLVLGVAIHLNLIVFPYVISTEVSYLPGLEDNRVLVGASHNVFVGKVLRKIGQTSGEAGPLTRFEIQIVTNVKGTLKGKVIVSQEGGYRNGILRLVENQSLMNVGTTYVFTTRGNEESGYLATSYPRGWFVVSTDATQTIEQLQALAAIDQTVLALQDAYMNEILLQVDVDNNQAFNSYQSLLIK